MPELFVGPEWSVCEEYWGFAEPPFSLAPNPRFLCMTPMHQAALNTLLLSVMGAEPLVALSGLQGCGKTSLCRKLGQELAAGTQLFIHCAEPSRVARDISRAVLGTHTGTLEASLAEVRARGLHLVLVLDDGHRAGAAIPPTLDVVRRLTPDATVVLVNGSAESAGVAIGPLRFSAEAFVGALDADSLTEALRFRMRAAWGPPQEAFAPDAYVELHALSRGIPRDACEIADNALFYCMRQRRSHVKAEAVRAVHALLA